MNNAYQRAPHADALYFADTRWWHWHKDVPAFRAFAGVKVSIQGNGEGPADADIHILRNLGVKGLSSDAAGVRTGLNGGFQAVNIAILAGAKRVLLLGFDMQGGHWHPEHPQPSNPSDYRRYMKEFEQAAPLYAKAGVAILNCSAQSALRCFPKVAIESLLPDP